MKSVAVAANAKGALEVFAIGTDGSLNHSAQTSPGGSWTAWKKTPGKFAQVTFAANADGRLEAFLLHTDGALSQVSQSASGAWGSVVRRDGMWRKIETARYADGRLALFALGMNNKIYQRLQNTPGGTWGSWTSINATYKDFDVAVNADGRLEMFAIASDNTLHQRWQTTANGGWTTFKSLGGNFAEIELTRDTSGRIQLFAVNNSQRLVARGQLAAGGRWSSWQDLGASAGMIRVASNSDGRLEVFAANPAGKLLHNWQIPSTPKRDYNSAWNLDAMRVQDVWNRGIAGRGVTIAVLDTGLDLDHVDIIDNLWTNEGEIAGNGIDDDGNGFIDDVHGWDFTAQDNDPTDRNGHGTHVAGIIAAASNGQGVTGIAPFATIMPIQVLTGTSIGSSFDIARGIRYAVDNGADIINISVGGEFNNSAVADAISYARTRGVLIVAGSGNDGGNSPLFPAAYSSTYNNVLSVGAHDADNVQTATTNNVGRSRAVQVDAPGVNIYGLAPDNLYRFMSGTSMAAPNVTGVAALILSANPKLTGKQVRDIIVATAKRPIATSDSRGGIDAKAAVDLALSSAYLV
jgi:hypothetical protein